jgi:hypothetical protein
MIKFTQFIKIRLSHILGDRHHTKDKPMRRVVLFLLITVLLAGCNLSGDDVPDQSEPIDLSDDLDEATQEASPTPLALPTQDQEQPTLLPIPTQSGGFSVAPTSAGVQQPAVPVQPQPIAPSLQLPVEGERAYGLTASGSVTGDGLNLLNVPIQHFAPNPVDNRYTVIDAAGNLYISGPNGAGAFRIEQSPYSQFPASTREENNAAAEFAAWSPNGQLVAFIVNGDRQAADGVWYFQPGAFAPVQFIVDCPSSGFVGCNIVRPSPADNIGLWESRELYWSADSQRLLINASLPGMGRRGLMVKPITRDERTRDERPPIYLYDYGTWGNDGRILASGRNPDGVAGIFWLNSDGSLSQVVYNASNAGLWMGWAAQQPDGDIVALGRPGGPDGPVAIYDASGNALTGAIGGGFPERVVWSPDRRAVLVVSGGRQYVADTSGQVNDITNNTGGLAANWLR